MIVADTSALISLVAADVFDLFLDEFDVHTTETVVQELEDMQAYDDRHGTAAETILAQLDRIHVHQLELGEFHSTRVDAGEGSCALLTKDLDARFLITDDLRALPELQTVADANVAISPIVLKAFVNRGVLDREDARTRLETLAEARDWLGAPIYRRALELFDGV